MHLSNNSTFLLVSHFHFTFIEKIERRLVITFENFLSVDQTNSALPYIKTNPFLLLVLWSIKSFFVYWTWDEKSAYADFYDIAIKPFNVPSANGELFRAQAITPSFGVKQWSTRLHVTISVIWALCLFINLMPIIRKKYMWLHRLSGKIFNISYLLFFPFTMYLLWHIELGPIVQIIEIPLAPITAYFIIKGYLEIQRKEVANHRSSMIMASAGLIFFLVIRLMLVFVQAVSIQFHFLGGPFLEWHKMNPKDYINLTFGVSSILGLYLCYGVAIYYAYILPAANSAASARVIATKAAV